MLLIPFNDFTKQKLNISLEDKNIELELLKINNEFYLNILSEDRILINGLKLSNFYPLQVPILNGAFLIDNQGGIIGFNTFVYYLEKNEIPKLFGG